MFACSFLSLPPCNLLEQWRHGSSEVPTFSSFSSVCQVEARKGKQRCSLDIWGVSLFQPTEPFSRSPSLFLFRHRRMESERQRRGLLQPAAWDGPQGVECSSKNKPVFRVGRRPGRMTSTARVRVSRAGAGPCRTVGGQRGVLQNLACPQVQRRACLALQQLVPLWQGPRSSPAILRGSLTWISWGCISG